MKYPDASLLVFSKAPDPGQVKTRLIPVIGEAGAAHFYESLLRGTLETAVNAGLCPVELWCSPTTSHPFFQQCKQRYGVDLYEQSEGDLGQRMSHAFSASGKHSNPLVLVGADCPALSAADLEEAFALLDEGVEVVLGPAEDGGYYLVGLRSLYPFIFDNMPWSTSTVLELTRTRLDSRQINCQYLAPHRDLDTPEDYRAWLESGSSIEPNRV